MNFEVVGNSMSKNIAMPEKSISDEML